MIGKQDITLASVMNLETKYVQPERRAVDKRQVVLQHICLQLASLGHKCQLTEDHSYLSVAKNLLKNYSEQRKLLAEYRCPADQRIEDFLNDYLKSNNVDKSVRRQRRLFLMEAPRYQWLINDPISGIPDTRHQFFSEKRASHPVREWILPCRTMLRGRDSDGEREQGA